MEHFDFDRPENFNENLKHEIELIIKKTINL